MLDVIKGLFAHQEWADASHWRVILGSEAARKDPELRERLVHLHGAQQVWMGRWQGIGLGYPKVEDHATLEDTLHFAQACHAALRAYLSLRKEADLAEPITYTNNAGGTHTQPLGQLMLHVAMHSHYHRGQIMTRLKQLGGQATDVDYIFWIWKGRPEPEWDLATYISR